MVEVIPSILVHSEQECLDRIGRVKPYIKTVQIDVTDGKFVSGVSWAEPEKIRAMVLPLDFEVHLMVNEPMAYLESWAKVGAVRAFIHVESPCDVRGALEGASSFGLGAGLAINPSTDLAQLEPFYELIETVLVMGVMPGASGQEFNPITVERVRELKEKMPWLMIGVDGGVNDETAPMLRSVGVDRLISASYLFSQSDIAAAVALLCG